MSDPGPPIPPPAHPPAHPPIDRPPPLPARRRPALVAQARSLSPLGPIVLAATPRGLAGLWFDGQAHHPGPLAAPEDATHPVIAQTLAALDAYWRGDAAALDLLPAVPVDAHGTPFQQRVWQALRGIAAGCTTSYGELAKALGCPAAVRAVAAAVGRNPVAIVVPCHRVVGSDGALRGYAGGLDRKRALLALEAATAPRVEASLGVLAAGAAAGQ